MPQVIGGAGTVARYGQRFRCPPSLPVNVHDHPLPAASGGPSARRRALLLGGAGTLLAGCASDSLSLIGSTIGGFGQPARYPISDAQIEAIPYATMGVRFGDGGGVVMVLASIDGDDLHWASADRVVLVTRRGRLVKTIGLSRDLLTTRPAGADALADALAGNPVAAEARVDRIIDLRQKDDFSVPVESRWDVQGEETVSLLGRERRLVRVRERMTVRKWRWSADNLYWLDAGSGQVWKARQQFCPEVPAMTLELLKPATG